ncbi:MULTISPECIES: hypothetical protein [Nocardia]|uniref:hypothetical protein n=1 Tax=Nocardia TaxID=1817 RepID=UPI001C3F2B7E|nr:MULTISPECIES: hypothetical protein [Nocardia]
MATIDRVAEEARFHRAALRARPVKRDAIRYACEQLDDPSGPDVRQWLADHGYPVGRTLVWKVVKEWRDERGLAATDTDSGERGLFSVPAPAEDTDGPAAATEPEPAAVAAAEVGETANSRSEQSEQPSGGPTVFAVEQTEPFTVPAPTAAAEPEPWGSGEQAEKTADTGPRTSEHRSEHPPVNTVNMMNTAAATVQVPADEIPAPQSAMLAPPAPVSPQRRELNTSSEQDQPVRQVRPLPTWPVLLMAFPAFVAIWSGWVGLGELTGFGVVHPLPGIADGFEINTAITLPIGVEAYASYALYVWLSGRVHTQATRTYAMASAFVSLAIGAAGQVAYHFMAARGITEAPWWIITLVACLPVAVVGMGAVLAHLVIRERHTN